MKAKYWALCLLACTGMAACSNNDDLAGDGGKGDGDATSTSYLAVNILNTGGDGTRANGYEAGTDAENDIENVRFYLFDAAGAAYEVEGGKSYVEASYTKDADASTGDNVEEIGEAVLVIDGEQTAPPASIVAVANPSGLLDKYSLTELRAVLASDYKDASGKFFMSNSVYVDGGAEVCAVPVIGHVASSSEDALANPVDIYIERVAAKVKVSFTSSDKTIDGCPAYLVSGTAEGDDAVYAKVQGWTLVNVPDKSLLVKGIDASWTDTSLGITTWNSAADHRSFWTKMPASGVTIDKSFAINDATTTSGDAVYTLENTSSTASDKTAVLVRVQLVKSDGTAAPRYVYLGSDTYASEQAVLNAILLTFLNAEGKYYVKTAADTYTTLRTQDLKFVTGASLGDNANSYRVYPQLKTPFTDVLTGEEQNVYTYSDGQYTKVGDINAVNTLLKKYSAQVWKDGYCYYTTPVKHLGSSGSTGEYGVVRNHVYEVSVTDIAGFGTPVYDPSEEIEYPVTPGEDYSYLAARVNILAWKVVSNDVTLGK